MELKRKRSFYEKYIKRLLDIVCSLFTLIVFWWLYIIVAILVKINLGSPVVFRQARPGIIDPKTGKEKIFYMYKFRTMSDKRDEKGNFLPDEVLEAAIIDGCGPVRSFVKMVIPLSLNSVITVATMQAVFCWNEYINAYTFTRSTNMKTITLGLNDYVGSMGLTDWGATFAAITVTVIPVFIFYFFSSKKMLAGMSAGAVKG